MTLRALTCLDHDVEVGFVGSLEAHPDFALVRRCADVADLLAAAGAGLADLAFVSPGLRALDREAVAGLAGRGVHVVGVTRRGDEDDERRLRQLGLDRVLRSDAPASELGELAAELASASAEDLVLEVAEPEVVQDPIRGRIVAVWGPKGAPGVTTVAVNLAAHLAGQTDSVLIIDADTWGASIAQMLAIVDEAPGIAAATRAADHGTLDRVSLARLAPVVLPGLRVLTGIPRPDRWPELRAAALETVLRMARTLASVVIVDCGFALEDDEELSYDTSAPRRNAAALTVLAEADDLVVVGSGDPISLQRLVRGVQELAVLQAPPPVVVVNRVRASAVGPHPERTIGEALARFSGLDDVVYLPYAGPECDRALLAGEPLVRHTPDADWVAALGTLADRLRPPSTDPGQGQTRRARRARLSRRVRAAPL